MGDKGRIYTGFIVYIYLYIFTIFKKSEIIAENIETTSSQNNSRFHFEEYVGNVLLGLNRSMESEKIEKLRNRRESNKQVADPCSRNWICKESNSSYLPRCYCDEECIKYNDCCHDSKYNVSTTKPLNKHNPENGTCEVGVFGYKDVGIYVISSCPTAFKYSEFSKRCSHVEDRFLVSSEDGVIFRNAYCAHCNNVTKYTVWTFRLVYSGNCHLEIITSLNLSFPAKLKYMQDNKCGIGFFPPKNIRFRTCIKPTFGALDKHGSSKCSIYQNPIYIGEKHDRMDLYRNVHCYNATAIETKAYECAPVYGRIGEDYKSYGNVRMTALFNIRPAIEIFGQKTCNVDEIYDKVKDICLPQTCKEKITNRCGYETLVNYMWKSEVFNFNTNDSVDVNFIGRVLLFTYFNLPIYKYDIRYQSPKAAYKCGVSSNNHTCCSIIIGCKFTNHAHMLITDIPKFLSDVKNMKWIYSEISESKNIVTASNFQNNDCHLEKYPLQHYRFSLYKLIKAQAHFENSSIFKRTNKVPRFVNGTIAVNKTSDIAILHWDIRYRSTTNTHDFPRDDQWSLFTFLTYVTLGMSSISLLLTMIVYRYLELFQSTSGVTTKHMMSTLLIAQVLFIAVVGADINDMFCLVVAVLSHYLWLSAFSWVSVFLLCVLKTLKMLFTCPGALTKGQSVSKIVYCFGYGLPSIVVVTSVIIDRFTSTDIGYTDGICFPTGVPGNIFTFALPITILLLINIIVLIISSVCMAKFNSAILQFASVQKVRSYIPVYLKLSILCSFPWLLGIISDIFDSDILRYIFTVLSGSHGIFVSLVFILSNNVTNRLRCSNIRNKTKDIETTLNNMKSFKSKTI